MGIPVAERVICELRDLPAIGEEDLPVVAITPLQNQIRPRYLGRLLASGVISQLNQSMTITDRVIVNIRLCKGIVRKQRSSV